MPEEANDSEFWKNDFLSSLCLAPCLSELRFSSTANFLSTRCPRFSTSTQGRHIWALLSALVAEQGSADGALLSLARPCVTSRVQEHELSHLHFPHIPPTSVVFSPGISTTAAPCALPPRPLHTNETRHHGCAAPLHTALR